MQFLAGRMELSISLRSYRLAAVKKAAYRVARACTVVLGDENNDVLPLTFLFSEGVEEVTARSAVRRFYEELLDQELREQVAEETAPLRTLIMAAAFSRVDLLRRED